MKYRDARHFPVGSIVEIEWDDARAGEDGWQNLAALEDLAPAKLRSVGFLHHVNRRELVYSNDVADGGDAHTSGVIPLGCIRRIVVLGP